VGGLGVAGYQLCFFAAVHDTGVAVGTVAALGSAPAFAGLGGWLVNRTKPGSAWAVATALAAVGVALMALSGSAEEVSVPGVVLALGAVPTALAYILFAHGLRLLPASEWPH
jgi:drug/metabolite transporter, DME family